MTAQVPDTFIYKGEKYELVGVEGGELIYPEQFGMEPKMMHTACYRGFYATYELTEDGLYLRELTLNEKNDRYLPIAGVYPGKPNDSYGRGAKYYNLNLSVNFTGKIRIAKDFIEELYVHMGFQKPTAFKTVLDITLQEGKIVAVEDKSEEMKQKRGEFKKRYERSSIFQRIEEAFNLDMDLE